MGNPIWQIKSLDLGNIAENIYFEYELLAIDTDEELVTYSLIAGEIPAGINLIGSMISGTPDNVSTEIVSIFTIRATTTTNIVSDVTLTITVSGQQAPEIITPSQNIGAYYYGKYVNFAIEAIDADIDDILTWEIETGELPLGLSLVVDEDNDRIAYVRGYPIPVTLLGTNPPIGYAIGYDNSEYDQFPHDFNLSSIDTNFQFGVSVTDSVNVDVKNYSIFLYSKDALTADNCTTTHFSCVGRVNPISVDMQLILVDTDHITADNCTTTDVACSSFADPITVDLDTITVDSDQITADNCTAAIEACGSVPLFFSNPVSADNTTILTDATPQRSPIILNTETNLGIAIHDNYYAYQFIGYDFDNSQLGYKEWITHASSHLPPNLQIDEVTGWLYGYLTPIEIIERQYTFEVVAYKMNEPGVMSTPHSVTITIVGDIANTISWITPNTMNMNNGDISELRIIAENTLGIELNYSIVAGSLPLGLGLDKSGLIIGRPNFGSSGNDTYIFTVNARDTTNANSIDINKEFTIIINQLNDEPYESLYLVAKPTITERLKYQSYIQDPSVYDPTLIYRLNDPYFSISQNFRFLLADGLAAKPIEDYADAMTTNHYTKVFKYGELKIAKALNDDKSVRYEVIYADIIDPMQNTLDLSINPSLILNGADADNITDHGGIPIHDANGNIIIHPSSIQNMRTLIIDNITQITRDTLPAWMTSRQDDNRALGFIPAVVIAYANPGAGDQLLYNIRNTDFNITDFNFEVDRYIWDNNMTSDLSDTNSSVYFHYSELIDPNTDTSLPTDGDDYTNVVGFGVDPFGGGVPYEGPEDDNKYIKFPQMGVFK